MKKLLLVLFVFGVSVFCVALAQDNASQNEVKQDTTAAENMAPSNAVTLTGKISDDGKTFVSDKDNKTWTVINPELLKGHEGKQVTLKAHVDEAKNEIRIMSVHKGEMKEMKTEQPNDEQPKN